jgi:hypothetical protein
MPMQKEEGSACPDVFLGAQQRDKWPDSLTWKRLSNGCRRPLEPSAAASLRLTT